jgi:hypothetical protein
MARKNSYRRDESERRDSWFQHTLFGRPRSSPTKGNQAAVLHATAITTAALGGNHVGNALDRGSARAHICLILVIVAFDTSRGS